MIWPFSILFDPIQAETIETHTVKKKPDWEALSPLLADKFSLYGNMLPSKNIAPPVGKIFSREPQAENMGMIANSRTLKTVVDIRSIFIPGSKYKEEKYTEKFKSGCEFTMNYKNMFMVVPTVLMYENTDEVVVKYFYKSSVKALQYYWFGFCSIYLSFWIIFGLIFPVIGFLFFDRDIITRVNDQIRTNDFVAHFSIIAFGLSIGFLLLGMALYFRKNLLKKAREKVRDFLDVI